MFRRLLAGAVMLVLPAMLAAQARPAASTAKAGAVHRSASQRQGDVVRPATAASPAGDVDHNQATGDKDEQQGPDAKEGPDVKEKEGPDVKEGPEANEGPEGPDVKEAQEGPNDGPNVERSEKGDDKQGEDDASKPVVPAASRHNSRVGSHKP